MKTKLELTETEAEQAHRTGYRVRRAKDGGWFVIVQEDDRAGFVGDMTTALADIR